jgi:hypothetical protein
MGWVELCVEPGRGKGSGIKQREEGANEKMQENAETTNGNNNAKLKRLLKKAESLDLLALKKAML